MKKSVPMQLNLFNHRGSVDGIGQNSKGLTDANQQAPELKTNRVTHSQYSVQDALWVIFERKSRPMMNEIENLNEQPKKQRVNQREMRGMDIAARSRIVQNGDHWLVPSQSKSGTYKVKLNVNSHSCTCLDFETYQKKCKHIFAVEFMLLRESAGDPNPNEPSIELFKEIPKVKKPTYRQDWVAYNNAQQNEKTLFQVLLNELCKGVGESAQLNGRPRLPLGDMLFSMVFKIYSTFSMRRFMSDLKESCAKGHISKVPDRSTIFNYFGMEMITDYLKMLIEESSLPLSIVEKDFAVDSTGLSSCRFYQWYHAKYTDPKIIDMRDWIKIHLMCGVKTHIVTAVEITDRHAGDSPQFAPLVEATAQNFVMDQISADKAYLSNDNLAMVARNAAMPYIPFRSNSKPYSETATKLWTNLYHYFALNQEKFFKNYHKRSNVESVFMMIKTKFGDSLRNKTERGQINEALCKVLAHNICVLIQAMYELDIQPNFWQENGGANNE